MLPNPAAVVFSKKVSGRFHIAEVNQQGWYLKCGLAYTHLLLACGKLEILKSPIERHC